MSRSDGDQTVRITVFERVRRVVLAHGLDAYGSGGRYPSGLLIHDLSPFVAGFGLGHRRIDSAFHLCQSSPRINGWRDKDALSSAPAALRALIARPLFTDAGRPVPARHVNLETEAVVMGNRMGRR